MLDIQTPEKHLLNWSALNLFVAFLPEAHEYLSFTVGLQPGKQTPTWEPMILFNISFYAKLSAQ
jgi:hypothetical protein